jgi:hypothetical protein
MAIWHRARVQNKAGLQLRQQLHADFDRMIRSAPVFGFVSLARLLRDTNRGDEARTMLAERLQLVHRGP